MQSSGAGPISRDEYAI